MMPEELIIRAEGSNGKSKIKTNVNHGLKKNDESYQCGCKENRNNLKLLCT